MSSSRLCSAEPFVFTLASALRVASVQLGSNESWNIGLELLICQLSNDNGQR
jgi:hypothetical protein